MPKRPSATQRYDDGWSEPHCIGKLPHTWPTPRKQFSWWPMTAALHHAPTGPAQYALRLSVRQRGSLLRRAECRGARHGNPKHQHNGDATEQFG